MACADGCSYAPLLCTHFASLPSISTEKQSSFVQQLHSAAGGESLRFSEATLYLEPWGKPLLRLEAGTLQKNEDLQPVPPVQETLPSAIFHFPHLLGQACWSICSLASTPAARRGLPCAARQPCSAAEHSAAGHLLPAPAGEAEAAASVSPPALGIILPLHRSEAQTHPCEG